MTFVDGFVVAVPTANKEAFRQHAELVAAVVVEYGALSQVKCWGIDWPDGKLNSRHTAVMRKGDESVVFSWITWPDKGTRDGGMEKVMIDPRMQPDANPMPFDDTRLFYGGTEMIVGV